MDFLETITQKTEAAKRVAVIAHTLRYNENMEILTDAIITLKQVVGEYLPPLHECDEGGDDYETHMRWECRQGNFV